MESRILLIGLGKLGSIILELLARTEGIGQIAAASRSAGRGAARCNLARLGAMAQGYSPEIAFHPLDLNDQAAIFEIVRQQAPDLILTTASMQTWWLPDLLPVAQAARLERAGLGVWLPVHLNLSLKLMRALRACDYQGITLTAPFPDVANAVLGRMGLAPTCGIGNLDEIVPKLRLLAAERLRLPPAQVRVLLVAHHALEPYVFGKKAAEIPPYFLRVEVDGQDVTDEVRAEELLLAPYPIPAGPSTHLLTAGSAVRLVRAILSDEEVLLHAPGPEGLPGGYPIVARRGQVHLAPIEGLTQEEAIAINAASHRFDGIERIEADGTVVFCPEAVAVLREELGYDCERLAPGEVEERAHELIGRVRAQKNQLR